jgi:hypothetical protein
MPFKSEKQRKWMHANKPKMAKKWEKEEESVDEEKKRDYKDEYKKFQSSDKAKKYRAELNKYNRQKGTYGNNDGKDASHKGGKIVGFEKESTNRGRAEKSRLKKEAISRDEWAQYPKYARKLKPYLQKLFKVPLRVKVIKQANHNPWIDVRVARFGKDIIPNDFRKKAAKVIGASGVRDWDNVNYGNIRVNSISLQADDWKKLLGNKVKSESVNEIMAGSQIPKTPTKKLVKIYKQMADERLSSGAALIFRMIAKELIKRKAKLEGGKDCCGNCKEGKECCSEESVNEAKILTDKEWRIAHGIFIRNKFFPTMQKNFERAIKNKDNHNFRTAIESVIRYMRSAPKTQLKMKIKESVNERKLSSYQKKAISIAIEMSGNMTGATKKIEKIKKGLSNDKKVKDALRLANESVNEARTINVEPNWEGMWRFFKRMAKTNPRDWKKMERKLGGEWLKIDKMAQQKGWKSESVDESGILYRAGVKKYGKEGMRKIQQAAGKRKSHAEIGKIKDKYEKESLEIEEGFGSSELMGKKDLAVFEKTRQKNAEVLGYKLTGKSDIKPIKEKSKVTK